MKKVGRFIVYTVPVILLVVAISGLIAPFRGSADSTGTTEVENTSSDGDPANDGPLNSKVSPDGRYVYFTSWASNLVPDDTNNSIDLFVHDRLANTTKMIDVNNSGDEGNYGTSSNFDVSDGGRYVVFSSGSTNLVTPDYNSGSDIFVRDMQTGTTSLIYRNSFTGQSANNPAISGDGNWIVFNTDQPLSPYSDDYSSVYLINRNTLALTRISNGLSGAKANNISSDPDINYDGSKVVFGSLATNLVSGDTNGQEDIFLWDKGTGDISRVSVSSTGGQANNYSQWAHISGAGSKMVFISYATNITSNGTTSYQIKAYLHDTDTGDTTLLNVTPTGQEGNGAIGTVNISENGNYAVFDSRASDLVTTDTNGSNDDAFVRDLVNNATSLVSLDSGGSQFTGAGSPNISADGQAVTFATGDDNLYLRYY